jgi:lipid-binding SYLF domain-containing protein
MKFHPFVVMPLAAALVVSAASPGITATNAEKKVEKATEVFQALMSNPKTKIPASVMQSGKGIVIIPDLIQAGLFFGGRRGEGIMTVRQADGTWSNPAFITLTGGSFGLQFGAQSSDVILVFNSQDTINDLLDGSSFKLAGTGTATAGPVGSQGYLSTDVRSKAKIYSYVRGREGLFAGISIEGAELSFDGNRDREFYGRPMITPQQIFSDQTLVPPVVVNSLKQSLNEASTAPAAGAMK